MTPMCWLCMEPIEPGTQRIYGGHPDAGRDESGWNIAHQSHPECFEVYRDRQAGVVRFPPVNPG